MGSDKGRFDNDAFLLKMARHYHPYMVNHTEVEIVDAREWLYRYGKLRSQGDNFILNFVTNFVYFFQGQNII